MPNNFNKKGGTLKCSICEDIVEKQDTFYGDAHTAYEQKPLCEICYYESEPNASLIYSQDEQLHIISDTRNETDGEFRVRWKSTDPWRGYYLVESERYSLVNTAELLSYHESAGMLEDFDSRIRELYDESNLEYVRAFTRSSNVFYQNYELFVKKDQILFGSLLVAKAKTEVDYDNPKWYRNILFDEEMLTKLDHMFPERELKVDADVLNLVKDYGDKIIVRI